MSEEYINKKKVVNWFTGEEISPFSMGELDKLDSLIEEIKFREDILKTTQIEELIEWIRRAIKCHSEEKSKLYKRLEEQENLINKIREIIKRK